MPQKKHVTILSLGAGIQSTAMALMIDRELLPGVPKPDWAIFADTMAEPPHVYETLEWLRERLSISIATCTWGDLARNTWKAITGHPVPERGHHQPGYIDLPVFSESGIGRRQCTGVYKIRPIKAEIRRLANSKPPHLTATQYLGISTNEQRRAKPSRDAWLTNRYPLIEHGLSRTDCIQWLDREYPGHPVRRSACYFLPLPHRRRMAGDKGPLPQPLPRRNSHGPADGGTPPRPLAPARRRPGTLPGRRRCAAILQRRLL